jgi:uncharacterized membrane protein
MTEQHNSTITDIVISKKRLEFLFDGIFAIAMTILVLELKVPELTDSHSVSELARALAHHGYTFGSYLLSFFMLGLFWYRHNQHYHHFQLITRGMLVFHLLQLSMAAFFPFCAALLGHYPTNGLSIVVYIGCVTIYFWGSWLNWVLAGKAKALKPEVSHHDYERIRNRGFRGGVIISVFFISYLLKVLVK